MIKFSALLFGASLITGASFAATPTPASSDGANKTFYYWLHPKLGMVKVDKATHAMVTSKRTDTRNASVN